MELNESRGERCERQDAVDLAIAFTENQKPRPSYRLGGALYLLYARDT